MEKYFSGEKLYGDDFAPRQIAKWIEDEKEAYADIESDNTKEYGYHELNKKHGYSKLKDKIYKNALCFGGGNCQEILPIIKNIKTIYAIEPSSSYRAETLNEKKIIYIKPKLNGKINAKNNSFDIITCFGVLHHIPNVTSTIKELKRTLKRGGYMLIREPIVSMGDWRKKRIGITKRERGIPLKIFDKIIQEEKLKIVYKARVLHPFTRRGFGILKNPFNNKIAVKIDNILGKIFSFNKKYHATKWYHKLQPQSVFYILKK
jgi:SAM-dependent methyltransferase